MLEEELKVGQEVDRSSEEKTEPTLLQRFKSSRFITSITRTMQSIAESQTVKSMSKTVDSIMNSKPVRALKYIKATTSPLVSIALYSAMIATSLSPAGAIVGVAIGVIGIAGVITGTLIDLVNARNIKKLEKESALLYKNREAKNTQDAILAANPKLKEALFPKEKEHTNKELHKEITGGWLKFSAITKAVAKYTFDIVRTLIEAPLVLGFRLTKSLATTLLFMAVDTKSQISIDEVQLNYKQQINRERRKKDTPSYSNIDDLKKSTREQRIQAMAVKKLSEDKSLSEMTDEQIKDKFEEIKKEIVGREGAITTRGNIITRAFRDIGEDIWRGIDPYSKYKDVGVLEKERELLDPVKAPKEMEIQAQKEKMPEVKTSEKTTPITATAEDVALSKPAAHEELFDKKRQRVPPEAHLEATSISRDVESVKREVQMHVAATKQGDRAGLPARRKGVKRSREVY